jgi:hypothetical protein
MKTNNYLDAVQAKLNISSDYGLSKALGISRQAVSHYRAGKGSFDDSVARRVAHILKMHPGTVVLDMHIERTKDTEGRSVWEEIARGFWSVLPLANDRRRMRRAV